jgi:hypothetical protein
MNNYDNLDDLDEAILLEEDLESLAILEHEASSSMYDKEQKDIEVYELCEIYMETIDLINDSHEEIYSYPGDAAFWIFYRNDAFDLSERILEWLHKKSDEGKNISRKECAIYVNLSYEPKEVQESLKDMPFSMLWDIYSPVIKANRIAWRMRQKALDGGF